MREDKQRTYNLLLTAAQIAELDRIGAPALVDLLRRDIATLLPGTYFHDDSRRAYSGQVLRVVTVRMPLDLYERIVEVGGVVYVRDVLECSLRSRPVDEPAVVHASPIAWVMAHR